MKALYDVAVVGAGITGLTLALALAKCQFNVIVIEKNGPIDDANRPKDGRVSSINLGSQAIFNALNVWSDIKRKASAFEKIFVFEPNQKYRLEFNSASIQAPQLGFILEHEVMLAALTQALNHQPVKILYGTAIQAIDENAKQIVITLDNETQITTKLVVGADGAQSKLRELANIAVKKRSYDQTALVAEISTEKSHQQTAWQCFLPNGPLAFLPLQDEHHCSIVWSSTPEEIAQLLRLPNEAFELKLKLAFQNQLGHLKLVSDRKTFPLVMRYANDFVKPRIALVGDAIHTIHPLAGQGLNLGLLDAACLAETLEKARDQAYDIGDYAILRRYVRWRKSHHVALIAAMALFKQGFGLSTPPFGWIREKIMQQYNQWDFLKRVSIEYATGLKGDLPKMCERL